MYHYDHDDYLTSFLGATTLNLMNQQNSNLIPSKFGTNSMIHRVSNCKSASIGDKCSANPT